MYENESSQEDCSAKMVNRNKSIAKKSANEASDSDFYIRKVYEHLKLSFSIEKQKKLVTRK